MIESRSIESGPTVASVVDSGFDGERPTAAKSLDEIPVEDQNETLKQRRWSWLAVLPLGLMLVCLMRFYFGYRIANHKELRKKYREITQRGRPVVICSNHLTMIDSVVLIWAFASMPFYFGNFKSFPWNVPALENFGRSLLLRTITYLGKCIPIQREGTAEHITQVLNKLMFLLRRGDACMIFPEGTRSRTGRVDPEAVTYGVGRVVIGVPNCDVLCVYLRGDGQDQYSNIPKKGENFTVMTKLITPTYSGTGRRAMRDISASAISVIRGMEEEYFAGRR